MHGHLFFAEAGDNFPNGSMSFWKGQPRLNRISPTSGTQGTTMYLRLTGANLRFPGTTLNISGTGVSATLIKPADKTTPTKLIAGLVIDAAAPAGTRDITVTTAEGTTSSLPFTIT